MIGPTALRKSVLALLALSMIAGFLAAAPSASAGSIGAGRATAAARSTITVCPREPDRNFCLAELASLTVAGQRAVADGHAQADAAAADFTGYTPAELRAAYGVPLNGSTQRVAVVDAYDDPAAESDLATYRANFGLPVCSTANGCFRKVNQKGAAGPLPRPDTHWSMETSMDIELVSAICPSCGITLVEANNDSISSGNLYAAARLAGTMAGYVSMSWGSADKAHHVADDAYFSRTTTSYVAAAGDDGYGAIWPSTSPKVTAVGGTTLTLDATGARLAETTWYHRDEQTGRFEGTGSGCSTFEPKPSWQKGPLTGTNCSKRAAVDVAAVADPDTGPAVFLTNLTDPAETGYYLGGGTSAAAPIVAAMEAVANPAGSGDNPVLRPYLNRSSYFDVADGSRNGSCSTALCRTRAGWDGPTGVGTPDAITAFAATRAAIAVRRGGVTSYEESNHTQTLKWSDSQGLHVSYTATGLPPGVHLKGSTFSGKAHKRGTYKVTVTGTDSSGASAVSHVTWTVKLNKVATSHALTFTGRPAVGQAITAYWGSFRSNSPRGSHTKPHWSIRWYADGKAIAGATSAVLPVTAGLLGKHLSYTLTAHAKHYSDYSQHSPSSAAVA